MVCCVVCSLLPPRDRCCAVILGSFTRARNRLGVRFANYSVHRTLQTTVYSLQSPVFIVQCAVCSVQCAVCSVQCTVCSVKCAVYSVQCAVCSVQCEVCSVQCAGCSVQYALYNVYCAVYSVPCTMCGAVFEGNAGCRVPNSTDRMHCSNAPMHSTVHYTTLL